MTRTAFGQTAFSGPALVALMRHCHVTIAEAAKRLQWPRCFVRVRRKRGLYTEASARDWVQAIVGCDPGDHSRDWWQHVSHLCETKCCGAAVRQFTGEVSHASQ